MENRTRIDVSSIGLLILRLGIGGYMLTHGWGKLQTLLSGNIPEQFDPIGLGPTVSFVLVVFAEFLCALLIITGLATRLATIPLVVAMGVAAFVAHGADPWTAATGRALYLAGEATSWASKQPALTYFFVFLALAFTGPGRLSLDALVGPRLKRRKTAR